MYCICPSVFLIIMNTTRHDEINITNNFTTGHSFQGLQLSGNKGEGSVRFTLLSGTRQLGGLVLYFGLYGAY